MTSPGARLDFVRGMGEINLAERDQTVGDTRAAQIKQASSAMYDMAATGSDDGDLWNWGMYDVQVAADIDNLIPDLTRFDTDGFSEQLYHLSVRELPWHFDDYGGRVILEVGCGLGQGLNYVSRIVGNATLVGLDLSPVAVARANARLSRGGLRYTHGDAEHLPFDDCSIDVVLNIESSHGYPDLGRFLDEVGRVLKPGGHLSHVDLFTALRYEQWVELLGERPELEVMHRRDISDQVRAAVMRRMEPHSQFRRRFDGKRMSPVARWMTQRTRILMFGGRFAGYQDGRFVDVLKKLGVIPSGRQLPVESYQHHVIRKRGRVRSDGPAGIADA